MHQRWNMDKFYSPEERSPGRFHATRFGVVPGSDMFDPSYFNIAAADAEAMDPQQRYYYYYYYLTVTHSITPMKTTSFGAIRV